jgi:hypothetical protein
MAIAKPTIPLFPLARGVSKHTTLCEDISPLG